MNVNVLGNDSKNLTALVTKDGTVLVNLTSFFGKPFYLLMSSEGQYIPTEEVLDLKTWRKIKKEEQIGFTELNDEQKQLALQASVKKIQSQKYSN